MTRPCPPHRLNLALAACQVAAASGLLAWASRLQHPAAWLGCAAAFALVMQSGYSLAHEAVHGVLHPVAGVNRFLGQLLFALFPGSFEVFAVTHRTHHRRNRSDAELQDYVLPGENAFLKRSGYYALLLGAWWLTVPLTSLVMGLWPGSARLRPPGEEAHGYRRFIQLLTAVSTAHVRQDLLVAGCLWSALWLALDLHPLPVAVCYAAFAFSWSSQQFIYHVRTPRHVRLGALDLRLWRPLQALYLNFNFHLTHHLNEDLPWTALPAAAAHPPGRGYLETYLRLWSPPQPASEAWPQRVQLAGPLPDRPTADRSLP